MEISMRKFTFLIAVATFAASLAGASQPSLAFGFHMPRLHLPHVPSPSVPANPYGQPAWGR